MKSVLISIKPKYCELIANNKKIIEVRKTKPKLNTPFKCYIYCTKEFYRKGDGYFQGKYCGKVIGEFICDTFVTDKTFGNDDLFNAAACLDAATATAYCTRNKMYGWHISNLIIYNKPKELNEFRKYLSFFDGESLNELEKAGISNIRIKKAPQSWRYIEGL